VAALAFFPFRNRFRNRVSPRYRGPIRVSRSSLFHTQPPRPWPSSCPTCRPSEKRATYLFFFFSFTAERGHKQPAKPLAFEGGRIASTGIDPRANVCRASFYRTTTSSASFSSCFHHAHIFVERLVLFVVVDRSAYSRSGVFCLEKAADSPTSSYIVPVPVTTS
jgi:hypothetical protein